MMLLRNPSKIVIHHSLTPDGEALSWQAIRRYHIGIHGWGDIGYHYGIEMVNGRYEILTGRMPDSRGAHTLGHNHDSIGICLVGNFDETEVPSDQWDLAVRFVQALVTAHTIAPKYIYGHRELDKNRACPGKYFDMEKFRKDVIYGI
jgi:hypothetical protein